MGKVPWEFHAVYPLQQIPETLRAAVGGKAWTLGELLRRGVPVPCGFVVPAGYKNGAAWDRLSKEALSAFDALHCRKVAVRSSAVNEDSTDASWAGQLDTYLGVNKENLPSRIRDCMRSNRSVHARSYAQQRGHAAGGVAVIVQTMVKSRVSGIAFSADPVTKDREHVVIEAGLGLGEPIVSGEVTPDMYVVHKQTRLLTNQHISRQEKMLVATGRSTTWRTVNPRLGTRPKLAGHEVQTLSEMVLQIEHFYEWPVDVEWAFDDQSLFILQARPITTI